MTKGVPALDHRLEQLVEGLSPVEVENLRGLAVVQALVQPGFPLRCST
jgi:hypothetical protein